MIYKKNFVFAGFGWCETSAVGRSGISPAGSDQPASAKKSDAGVLPATGGDQGTWGRSQGGGKTEGAEEEV